MLTLVSLQPINVSTMEKRVLLGLPSMLQIRCRSKAHNHKMQVII